MDQLCSSGRRAVSIQFRLICKKHTGGNTGMAVLLWLHGTRIYEDDFVKCWAAAGSDLAWEKCDYRDLQGTGGGTGGVAKVEPRWRPAGGFDGSWRRVQSGVLLSGGALRVLEEGVAGAGIAYGHVWGEFYRPGFV